MDADGGTVMEAACASGFRWLWSILLTFRNNRRERRETALRAHLEVRLDLARLGQLDHVHGRPHDSEKPR
jgi:hypothetical protein